MTINIRLARDLYNMVLRDICRPHKFAAERVGFLFTRKGDVSKDTFLVLGADYISVPDEHYIDDSDVGARINGDAIRSVMQKAMSAGLGVFHVHFHEHIINNCLGFSRTDIRELHRLIPSFQAVCPDSVHGALLLGKGKCAAIAWPQKQKIYVNVSHISIVGFPPQFHGKGILC